MTTGSKFEQLHMRCPSLKKLPPISMKEGFGIHTHIEGQEDIWEDVIMRSFGQFYSFENFLIPAGGYKPEYILYVTKDGEEISTAMGTEHKNFPGEGWLRMVGTVPESRGLGAGKLVCLVAMHSLAERGYNSVVLSTDDDRLGAITMYLSLGFEPIIFDIEHKNRWAKVKRHLENNGIALPF